MGDIVNLNRARKDRAKAEARARAATNRVAHGRTKAEKQAAAKTRNARRSIWTARSWRIERPLQALGARISRT